jgi:hypothetical protein
MNEFVTCLAVLFSNTKEISIGEFFSSANKSVYYTNIECRLEYLNLI